MEEGTVSFVMAFPRPWPPKTPLAIFSNDEMGIKLSADLQGRLTFERSSSGALQRHLFQPIRIEGAGRAIVTFWWNPQYVGLSVNGVDVLEEEKAQGKALILNSESGRLPVRDFIIGDIDLTKVNDETERFFLKTIIDIGQKLRSGESYEIIRASGLLRQLFLDSHPLVIVVNRKHKIKLQFETIDYRQEPPLSPDPRRLLPLQKPQGLAGCVYVSIG